MTWRKENKYSRWYDALMEKGRHRELEKPYERHHVWPISLGGAKKSEIIKLTRREHFLAHWLLVKFVIGPKCREIAYSLMMLIKLAGSCSSWRYEVAKKHVTQLASESLRRQRLDPKFNRAQSEASSKALKKQWQDQGFKDKVATGATKSNKKRWEDSEFRKKHTKLLAEVRGRKPRRGINKNCKVCDKEFYVAPYRNQAIFCSNTCHARDIQKQSCLKYVE